MNILEALHITKRYQTHTALDDVSIAVEKGKIFGLLGPNGAGKTTLIRIINQIIAPDQGHVLFDNLPLNTMHIGQIGYLPEERGLYKKMKVGEQILYLAQLKGLSQQEAMKKCQYWFEHFEIKNWWNKRLEELSKGMQQKVQFISTVLHEPKLIILDEPFSGFDPINANIIKQEILNLKAKGVSIIFSTHRMESVEELCDNIALINQSKKVLDGSVKDIKQQFKKHTFELTIANANTDAIDKMTNFGNVLEVVHETPQTLLKINLNPNISTNELLNAAMQIGQIVSFKEILPTINDIFIELVGEK